jgi:hypothetical protein
MDGVAEPRITHDWRAELAAFDIALGAHEQRVRAGVEVDHELDAGLFGRLDHGAPLRHVGRQRLLDQDVLAGGEHGQRRVLVEIVRGGDGDGLDVARCQIGEAGRPAATVLLGKAAGARLVAVADHRQFTRVMPGQRQSVIATPYPGADDSRPDDASHPPILCAAPFMGPVAVANGPRYMFDATTNFACQMLACRIVSSEPRSYSKRDILE